MVSRTAFFQTCLGVFQGGGCRAAAFAGAFEEAVSRGVNFAEVAGTSAGAIAAALIGAGATPVQLRNALLDMDFKTFLAPPEDPPFRQKFPIWARGALGCLSRTPASTYTRFLSHLGLYSSREIERWINEKLCEIIHTKRRRVTFSELPVPTWVVATDLKTREAKIWSSRQTPNEDVATAIRASCSIPFFFQPVNGRYVDGGALSNLPSFVYTLPGSADRPLSTRVLAFTLDEKTDDLDVISALDIVKLLLNAIVDGGRELQTSIQRNVHRISIPTEHVRATDFASMDAGKIEVLMNNGRNATAEFFDTELQHVRASRVGTNMLEDIEEVYSAITETLQSRARDILICEKDTNWLYPLFPTVLSWRSAGVRVRAILEPSLDESEGYRRRLLVALGIEVCEVDQVALIAYLSDPSDSDTASAIVEVSYSNYYKQERRAVRYFARADFKAIECIRDKILAQWSAKVNVEASRPQLTGIAEQEVLIRLRKVRQYEPSSVNMRFEDVQVADLLSLTRYVREFKSRQIIPFVELLKDYGLSLFSPSAVVLSGGKHSVIGPPVVERSGNNFILIEGTTRAVHCRDRCIEKIRCVVVDGVQDELPSNELIPIGHVRMSGRHIPVGNRYEGFNHSRFRHIEKSLRPPTSL